MYQVALAVPGLDAADGGPAAVLPGDCLGIACANPPREVMAVLALALEGAAEGADGAEAEEGADGAEGANGAGEGKGLQVPEWWPPAAAAAVAAAAARGGAAGAARAAALVWGRDLSALPRAGPLLPLLARHCADPADAARLRTMAMGSRAAFDAAVGRHSLAGALRALAPSCRPPLPALLRALPPLAPRLYSIAGLPARAGGGAGEGFQVPWDAEAPPAGGGAAKGLQVPEPGAGAGRGSVLTIAVATVHHAGGAGAGEAGGTDGAASHAPGARAGGGVRDETRPVSTGGRDETCAVSTGGRGGGGGVSEGVCTAFLEAAMRVAPGATAGGAGGALRVFVRRGGFRPPLEPSAPLLMLGLGTGGSPPPPPPPPY